MSKEKQVSNNEVEGIVFSALSHALAKLVRERSISLEDALYLSTEIGRAIELPQDQEHAGPEPGTPEHFLNWLKGRCDNCEDCAECAGAQKLGEIKAFSSFGELLEHLHNLSK